jgi:hypothetical protein
MVKFNSFNNINNIKFYGIRAVTFVEILIAVAMFAVAFMPIASIISKTSRRTHDLNFEITAEQMGKSIMEQILKSVSFLKVTNDITLGLDNSKDLKLELTDKSALQPPQLSGDKSGSVIKFEGAEYMWEIEVTDINAKDLPVSFWLPDNNKGTPWPTNEKGTQNNGLDKAEKFLNVKSLNYIKGGQEIILKTVKLRISWQNMNETANNFKDPRRKFILVTRKARLEDDTSLK